MFCAAEGILGGVSFQPVRFAEDLDWGMRALMGGRQLVFNTAVTVIHSHTRPPAYHMKRSYISGRIVPKILHLASADSGIQDEGRLPRATRSPCRRSEGIDGSRDYGLAGVPTSLRGAPEFLATVAERSETWQDFFLGADAGHILFF